MHTTTSPAPDVEDTTRLPASHISTQDMTRIGTTEQLPDRELVETRTRPTLSRQPYHPHSANVAPPAQSTRRKRRAYGQVRSCKECRQRKRKCRHIDPPSQVDGVPAASAPTHVATRQSGAARDTLMTGLPVLASRLQPAALYGDLRQSAVARAALGQHTLDSTSVPPTQEQSNRTRIKSHILESPAPVAECSFCSQGFAVWEQLLEHIHVIHPDHCLCPICAAAWNNSVSSTPFSQPTTGEIERSIG